MASWILRKFAWQVSRSLSACASARLDNDIKVTKPTTKAYRGTGFRGLAIFIIVLVVGIWIFTSPDSMNAARKNDSWVSRSFHASRPMSNSGTRPACNLPGFNSGDWMDEHNDIQC